MIAAAALWASICAKQNVASTTTSIWWDIVVQRYSEPQRAYHTMEHISELVEHLRLANEHGCIKDPVAIGFALFFHDIVYDPKAKDNEEQSVAAFSQFCDAAHTFQKSQIDKICDVIIATKDHVRTPVTADSDVLHFLDMDLGILAAPHSRFVEYGRQIRAEYSHLDDCTFVAGRTAVLKHFLGVTPLFKTTFFQHRWETLARKNLEWEINELACRAA